MIGDKTRSVMRSMSSIDRSRQHRSQNIPGNCTLEAIEIEPPKLLKDEDVLQAVARLCKHGSELKAAIDRISSSPFPSGHCKQRMHQMIEQLAQSGCPDVTMLIEHDQELAWQTQRMTSQVFAEQRLLAFTEVPDTIALFAWLHKDALIKRLDAEIDAKADDSNALSHAERQRQLSDQQIGLLDVERQEVTATGAAKTRHILPPSQLMKRLSHSRREANTTVASPSSTFLAVR
jgi:hypothetical protein